MIAIIWHSEKGRNMETKKISGCQGLLGRVGCLGRAQRSFRTWKRYLPFRVGPRQRFSCGVLFTSIAGDQVRFRSKGKPCSLIKERRGASSCSRTHSPPEKPQPGASGLLYYRVLRSEEAAEFSRDQRSWAARSSRLQCRAQSLRTVRRCHLGLECGEQCFCAEPAELRRQCSYFTPGTLVWRAGFEATACSSLWASETRLSTEKKKKKKVRLYFITQILFLFPRNC